MQRLKSKLKPVLALLPILLLAANCSSIFPPSADSSKLNLNRFQPGQVSLSDQAKIASGQMKLDAGKCISAAERNAISTFMDTAAQDRQKLRTLIEILGSAPGLRSEC